MAKALPPMNVRALTSRRVESLTALAIDQAKLAMVEGDLLVLTGLNLLVNGGKYVNGKTSDDDIHMTIMGYYIPELD